jgi:hypothetical protein
MVHADLGFVGGSIHPSRIHSTIRLTPYSQLNVKDEATSIIKFWSGLTLHLYREPKCQRIETLDGGFQFAQLAMEKSSKTWNT